MSGHLLKDYPLIQKMGESWRFKRKGNSRAMITVWSDSDTSDSESDEEHNANICLMARKGQDHEPENTNEVDIAALYECSKDELINALISFAELEQRCSSKYKDLKRNFQEVKQKGIALEKINNHLHIKIRILENKNEEL